ncbi:hypothetical protein [Sphingobacterium puteale]|uniref:hypothetical protein n=1 Tax=Sphingobacterium puteale TaxID=2420510 RepID=UPI003D95D4D7
MNDTTPKLLKNKILRYWLAKEKPCMTHQLFTVNAFSSPPLSRRINSFSVWSVQKGIRAVHLIFKTRLVLAKKLIQVFLSKLQSKAAKIYKACFTNFLFNLI